jgi:hypothetical protein
MCSHSVKYTLIEWDKCGLKLLLRLLNVSRAQTTRTPAPDLLAACKEALNYLHDTCDDNDLPPILTTMLNTAIAKAEGR